MRHLAAALTFRGSLDPDAMSFDPTQDESALPALARTWPSLREPVADRRHDARMARVLPRGHEAWPVGVAGRSR